MEGTPRTLAPHYYLEDFHQLIDGVEAQYGFLLSAAEQSHIASLRALSLPVRMLYARLVNRRGPCFRTGKLYYPEIGDLTLPLAELLAAGLLIRCDDAPEAQFFACFTYDELKPGLPPHKHSRKAELLAFLANWDGYPQWVEHLLAQHAVVRIPATDPWPFLRFLFFGELRDNLADFVTRALGHIVTESIDPAQLTACFRGRAEAEHAYLMACLYRQFRTIREIQPALAVLEWWHGQGIMREQLAAGRPWFDRLVDRLGRLLEREGEANAAMALYATSPIAPARERRARLLLKSGDRLAALALLQDIQNAPCHNEEAYAARQIIARLEKAAKRSEARHYQHESTSLTLDYPDGGVEQAVLTHYRSSGWQGVHSENWLWNGCFGLLLWDIIYDPAVGMFHSPLQFAPSDLHDPGFYPRRQPAFEARLEILNDPLAALNLMTRNFTAKAGIANPFVSWHEDLPAMLSEVVNRLPPTGLAAALRHLAQNIRRHASGLPDLFLWNGKSYRFIEIKAENDHLSGHQYEWLRILKAAGINVSLEKITRPAAKI